MCFTFLCIKKYVLIHLDKLVSNLGYYSLFKQLQGSVKKEISKIYIRQEYLSRKSFSFGKDALNKLQFSNAKHNYLLLKQLPKNLCVQNPKCMFPNRTFTRLWMEVTIHRQIELIVVWRQAKEGERLPS